MMTIEDAILLAVELHKGKVDKQGIPYILHPLWVMSQFTDPTEQMVAVLHDTVEDTWLTLEDLRMAGYAPDIIEALDALTRREGETYAAYIERLSHNALARRVKLADLRHNLSRILTLPDDEQERLGERYAKAMNALRDSWDEADNWKE